MANNHQMAEIRLTTQSPNRNYNQMNSSIQFIPDLTLENAIEQIPLPQKLMIKKGILKRFYYEDVNRKKIIGCNIYVNEMNEQQLQLSKRGKQCRICMADEETSRFISPCACKGTLMFVHEECLKLWILQKNGIEDVFKDKIKCELCHYRFRMQMEITNRIDLQRFKKIPSNQKLCWLIYLLIIITLISGLVALFMEFQLSNIGIDALMTIMIVLCVIFLAFLITSIIYSLQIEMIENWSLFPFKPRDVKQGNFFQLQSQMGNSLSGSPLARKRTVHVQTCPPLGSLQVIQINQLMTSGNLSEQ
ncbi:unnamed protein product [Paramecium sonneborni]|uniref:RING-CH-type domain-containing protein n=1 Tax=Paramecium sonneborni TaxID=65129 RepID=A0A8S1L7H4_9CILI|nr:unnamed protein product [Paramecium sonneborni]